MSKEWHSLILAAGRLPQNFGAGNRNRTGVSSLEDSGLATRRFPLEGRRKEPPRDYYQRGDCSPTTDPLGCRGADRTHSLSLIKTALWPIELPGTNLKDCGPDTGDVSPDCILPTLSAHVPGATGVHCRRSPLAIGRALMPGASRPRAVHHDVAIFRALSLYSDERNRFGKSQGRRVASSALSRTRCTFPGAGGGTRTHGLLIKSQLLWPLSYAREWYPR